MPTTDVTIPEVWTWSNVSFPEGSGGYLVPKDLEPAAIAALREQWDRHNRGPLPREAQRKAVAHVDN